MKKWISIVPLLVFLLPVALFSVWAHSEIASLRGGVPLDTEGKAAEMAKPEKDDLKRKRNYPMQPPVIPHNIQGYQVDKNYNKCLSCHARSRAQVSQAPMISITHYMDRDGNFLADVSPRRYFCNQCHVIQTDAQPRVKNDFEDIDDLLRKENP